MMDSFHLMDQDERQTTFFLLATVFLSLFIHLLLKTRKCSCDSNVTDKDEGAMEVWKAALDCIASNFEITWPNIDENTDESKLVADALRGAQSMDLQVKVLSVLKTVIHWRYVFFSDEAIDLMMLFATNALQSEVESLQSAGAKLWITVIQLEYPRDEKLQVIKNDVVLEKARGFVRKASKHFPEFVTQLLKAIEREDIPADPEDDHVKFSNETSQTDEIEEENTKEWIPNALLNRCLYDIGNNFPLMVRDYLLPYVKTAIVDTDLKKRFAAVYTLRCASRCMNSDDDAVILLKPFLPLVSAVTRDQQSLRLRSEALHVISSLLVNHPLLIPDGNEFNVDPSLLLNNLVECMNDHMEWLERKDASAFYIGGKDYWRTHYVLAIHVVISTAYKNAQVNGSSGRPETFVLSPFYDDLMKELLASSNRFRYAIQSVCRLLACTPEDCYSSMIEYTESVILFLRQMIDVSTSHYSGCRCHEATQGQLCIGLPRVMKALKAGEKATIEFHDQFTTCLMEIIENRHQDQKPVDTCVLEALSEMMPLLGRAGLQRYAYILVFYIDSVLREPASDDESNSSSTQIKITIHLIGDLFTTLKTYAAPYLNQMMKLLHDIKGMSIPVRIECVSALGKVAAAVGGNCFHPYLGDVLQFLQESSELVATPIQSGMDGLAGSCFETYTSLICSVFAGADVNASDTRALAIANLLPACYASVSKLMDVLSNNATSFETLTSAAHLVGNLLLKFETEKVLNGLGVSSETCKKLLTEAVGRDSTSKVVQVVCSSALRNMMEGTNCRDLN